MIESDHTEEQLTLLKNAVKEIKNVDGFTCEIGIRKGGSSHMIMKTLKETKQKKIHIGIDPYGNIEYTCDNTLQTRLGYDTKMKQTMLADLYKYCYENEQEFIFFPFEDTEFFKRYEEGIPIYYLEKRIINKYALVYFDGPHSSQHVKTEFDFFKDKMPLGAYAVFDDIYQYPHMNELHEYIESCGFKLQEKNSFAASYKKI